MDGNDVKLSDPIAPKPWSARTSSERKKQTELEPHIWKRLHFLNTKQNLAVKVTVSSSLALSESLPLNAAAVRTSTGVVFQTRVPFLLPFLPPVGTSFRKGKGS